MDCAKWRIWSGETGDEMAVGTLGVDTGIGTLGGETGTLLTGIGVGGGAVARPRMVAILA